MIDTISRQGVVAWLDNMGYPKLADKILDEKRFPTVKPEQRTDDFGKWKKSDLFEGMLSCSQCGTQRNPRFNLGLGSWNYCPNCGCKMEAGG